ncbi:hypothetical protein [Pseudomonas sp. UMAB-40]|uniref:hypothetical protein n=1 Tax=Pseudomonas sp. UMAB-40 TaxID=1365407 RepID=UPI001C5891E8|nr:hypothetical protein [Pseudomonas sp. UMAB-40]
MSRQFLLHDVQQAAAALREAQISLSLAIKQAYPLGTKIIAKIGERKLTVCVTGYGANWSSPGVLIGDNVSTGKSRRFNHTAIIQTDEEESEPCDMR